MSFHTPLSCFVFCLLAVPFAANAEPISYNEEIRPILNTACMGCHGGVKKSAGVSFIYREEALGVSENGKRVVVPGDPEASELVKRITSTDPRTVMPPAHGEHHHVPLKQEEISKIIEWIRQGAPWEEHWAYIPPKRLAVSSPDKEWVRTGMDAYVLQRLEKNGRSPSPEAPKAQWLRRASLDLTGLPPSLEEVEAFEKDGSDDAYEKVVDRLLASPRFGERWASMWMDLARYADTQGYQTDRKRTIWPYRNWLIDAFNADMPFPQFIRDQLAGDLVEQPTTDQLIATGFIRMTQTMVEGGTDDEEFRVDAVKDRVNTTWSAFQGLTFSCVQCHSHPYEPIPHEDYYRFMSYFNSTEDCDQDNDYPLHLIAHDLKERQKATDAQLAVIRLRREINERGRRALADDAQWVSPLISAHRISAGTLDVKDGVLMTGGTQPPHTHYNFNASAPKGGERVSAVKVTILPDTDDPADPPFRGAHLSQFELKKKQADGKVVPVPIRYVYADSVEGPLGQNPQAALNAGGAGFGGYPKLFRKREGVFVLQDELELNENEHLVVYIRCAAGTSGGQNTALRRFTLSLSASPAWKALLDAPEHGALLREIGVHAKTVGEVKGFKIPISVEREAESIRESRVFIGGNRLNKGEAVTAGVPAVLNPFDAPAGSRLAMADWLAHAENPLTARVFANRVFSELFGRGIVQTLGDFGTSGLPPSNLPLLDHLAIYFAQDSGWKLKPLLKHMVLSATYRQDHRSSEVLAREDPQNLEHARGPRTRLSAEMVRDHALQVSGLIAHRLGGPSVMPPQPEGVWQSVYNGETWTAATGPDRYRRALYTYWKRTSAYPSMMTFDAASREVCSIQRITTNIPLQPLVTLNDPVYVEFAQGLAGRLESLPAEGVEDRLRFGYRLVTQQPISSESLAVLETVFEELVLEYQTTPFAPLGESPEAAAWVNIASILLNIDPAMTK